MKKNIAVFGGSLFEDIKYIKGSFIPTPKQAVAKLSKEYNIDNYSMEEMSVARAKRLIETLPMKQLYSDCILALGEKDLDNPLEFKNSLRDMITYLQENHIRPLLVSLPKELMLDRKAILIQEIIDQLAVENNVDYIYEGKTSKLVSYMVLEEDDFTNAILHLC